MKSLNGETIPEEIEVLKPFAHYLMWEPTALEDQGRKPTLDEWHARFYTWSVESMICGLEELVSCAGKGKVLYDVYSPEQIAEDPSREHVKLFFIPSKIQPSDKPFVLVYAGGGYTAVCDLAEGFPIAARMTELGYNVFVPTYRVGLPDLMPKPLEDVDAALGYILAHQEDFHLRNTQYILNGFSAGAHLICLWGTEKAGYARYGKPKPHALVPVYTLSRFFADGMDEKYRMIMLGLLNNILGTDYDPELPAEYEVLNKITAAFPPCYLIHAKDDGTVDYRNSTDMARVLSDHGVAHRLELVEKGDHGFGDGRGTDAFGWIDRALRFSESV